MNQKPDKFISALYGGIIMAIISNVPFLNFVNCLCCAGILFGGVMAVFFYKNNFTPDTPPFTSGDCMAVGAQAGVVSAVIGTFLSLVFVSMFGNVMGEFILNILHNSNVNLPDETLQQIEESFHRSISPLFIFLEFGGKLVVDTLFGLLGGLIGYSIFRPRNVMMPPPPMPPPSPAATPG